MAKGDHGAKPRSKRHCRAGRAAIIRLDSSPSRGTAERLEGISRTADKWGPAARNGDVQASDEVTLIKKGPLTCS